MSVAAHFAKRNTKFRRRRNPSSRTLCVHYGARSEGEQKFLPRRVAKRLLRGIPPNPLPFCPPERLDFKIRNSDFRQKMFELRSKNTANFHFLWNRKKQPRRKAPRHGISPRESKHFWGGTKASARQCGSSCAKAQRKRSFQNQSFFFRL